MNYHTRIMNIPAGRVGSSEGMRMYRLGHRDARHAAAEIASEAEARVTELTQQSDDWQEVAKNENDRRKAAEARVADLTKALRGAMPWHPLIVDRALAAEKGGGHG